MNWLAKMFKEKSDVETLTPDQKSNQQMNEDRFPVPENLFVDHTPPPEKQENSHETGDCINIQTFLDQDYFGQGYKDGFNYHTPETLNQHVKCIKSDYRIKLDLLIDMKRRKILELRNQNIEVGSLSDRISRQIELLISDLTVTIERLEKEKVLSSEDEGWIMKAVNAYREGFSRGFEMYNDERLIGISTGFFN